jgi:RNA polymerase sigma-70 factor (ECF subfamily)
MRMEFDERRQIERCRDGDMAAWREMVEAHYEPLLAIAYRILLNREEAQDAVQEAWIRIVRSIAHFDGRSAFRTWAAEIVIRAASTRARSRRPSLTLEDAPARFQLFEEGSTALETRMDVRDALATLSVEERIAVTLHYGEGYAFREIAAMLGIPQRTAANRAYRGMKTLRDRMNSLCPGKADKNDL